MITYMAQRLSLIRHDPASILYYEDLEKELTSIIEHVRKNLPYNYRFENCMEYVSNWGTDRCQRMISLLCSTLNRDLNLPLLAYKNVMLKALRARREALADKADISFEGRRTILFI